MTEKYWHDYTEFIKLVETTTGHSPSSLLEIYTDLLESLEDKKAEKIMSYEFEIANDVSFRDAIQTIIDDKTLLDNELKSDFELKVNELDKRMKMYLSKSCAAKEDWYKNIELDKALF